MHAYSDSEMPEVIPEISPNTFAVEHIKIRRSTLKKDLIKVFEDENILNCVLEITVVDHRGREEEGKGSGVLRDVFCSFWKEFFSSLTVGALEKVPNVRHDHGKNEWVSIARILVYGVKMAKYFPLDLSSAFIACVLFGEENVTTELLYEYVCLTI